MKPHALADTPSSDRVRRWDLYDLDMLERIQRRVLWLSNLYCALCELCAAQPGRHQGGRTRGQFRLGGDAADCAVFLFSATGRPRVHQAARLPSVSCDPVFTRGAIPGQAQGIPPVRGAASLSVPDQRPGPGRFFNRLGRSGCGRAAVWRVGAGLSGRPRRRPGPAV